MSPTAPSSDIRSWSVELRLQLLDATVVPPGRVRLYAGSDNQLAAWSSPTRAVESWTAFAGPARAGLMLVDADGDTADVAVKEVAELLKDHGVDSVILASGGEGRRHLFAVVDFAPLVSAVEVSARRHPGTGVRVGDGTVGVMIRPPGTPHRTGAPVRLLSPSTAADALAALSPRVRRDIPARTVEWLGRLPGETERSETAFSIVMSCLQHGWSLREIHDILAREPGGQSLQQRNPSSRKANEWFLRTVRAAQSRVDRQRPAASHYEISELLAAAVHDVELLSWAGRTGQSDRKVLLAILRLCQQNTQLRVYYGQRDLGLDSGVTKNTARIAGRRLADRGLLEVQTPRQHGDASEYTPVLRAIATLSDPQTTLTSTTGGVFTCGSLPTLTHDAFARGDGLGGRAAEVYHALDATYRSAEAIAEATTITTRTVRSSLQALHRWGLAAERSGGWARGSASLDEVARRRGTEGRTERRRRRYDWEREAFRGPQPPNTTYVSPGVFEKPNGSRVYIVQPVKRPRQEPM